MPSGLFLGLTTLDVVHLVEETPGPNQKLIAVASFQAAGGPATNAAVAFAARADAKTRLLAELPEHALSVVIKSELEQLRVSTVVVPSNLAEPKLASILVHQRTGDRAVVSGSSASAVPHLQAKTALAGIDFSKLDILLVDGYQTELALTALELAREHNVTTVLDGGSFKPYTPQLLPLIDIAIVSNDFQVPNNQEVLPYLLSQGVQHAVVTNGEQPLRYQHFGSETILIEPPKVEQVTDTLGAGDFFHGSFCYWLAKQLEVTEQTVALALKQAAEDAAISIQSFGTRAWLADIG